MTRYVFFCFGVFGRRRRRLIKCSHGSLWFPTTSTKREIRQKPRSSSLLGSNHQLQQPLTCSVRHSPHPTPALMEASPFLVEPQKTASLLWITNCKDRRRSLLQKICMEWNGNFVIFIGVSFYFSIIPSLLLP